MEIELEQDPYYPDSPVELQTTQGEVPPTAVVAIEIPLLPGGGYCVITATSQTGRTGEEEHHSGIHGTREEVGGELGDRDLAHVVVTTWRRSCAAERPEGKEATLLHAVVRGPGAQMKRKEGEENGVKGRTGQRSPPVTSP